MVSLWLRPSVSVPQDQSSTGASPCGVTADGSFVVRSHSFVKQAVSGQLAIPGLGFNGSDSAVVLAAYQPARGRTVTRRSIVVALSAAPGGCKLRSFTCNSERLRPGTCRQMVAFTARRIDSFV
jgi:hypothetical protein